MLGLLGAKRAMPVSHISGVQGRRKLAFEPVAGVGWIPCRMRPSPCQRPHALLTRLSDLVFFSWAAMSFKSEPRKPANRERT